MNLRKCCWAIAACCCVGAQNPKLEFEVASVRVAEPAPLSALSFSVCPTPTTCPGSSRPGPITGGPGTSDPVRMTYRGVSLLSLVLRAFGEPLPDQISGPSWLFEPSALTPNRYDILAKVPPGATVEQANEMLKNLLVDRFHLVFHTVKKDFETYTLTVAKGGAKLTPAAPPDGTAPPAQRGPQALDRDGFPVLPAGYPNISGIMGEGVTHLAARMATTEDLLQKLQSQLITRHLENKTGLTDKYDFKLEYSLTGLWVPPTVADRMRPSPGDASEPAPDLFTALEKQLGLKLEKSKVALDAIVIDSVDKTPIEN